MKRLVMALVLGSALAASATTYYVDSIDGDDTRAGTCEKTAWKSLSRANKATLQPGDKMLFRRGGTWRGQLDLKSGSPAARTYYGAYGKGPKPVFLGSLDRSQKDDWTEIKPGLWSTRVEKGQAGAVLRDAAALKGWHPSFEQGVKGTAKWVKENGVDFLRVTCTATVENASGNFLQLFGPSVEGLPSAISFRFKMRGGFLPKEMNVIMQRSPYTCSAKCGLRFLGKPDANGWQDTEAILCHDGGETYPEGGLHINLGTIARAGQHIDLRFEKICVYNLAPRARLGADVGILILNDGETWGIKKWGLKELQTDLDYWYDPVDDRVVVKLDRNPAQAYKSVELALTRVVIPHLHKHDVTVEAFTIRNSGGFALAGSGAANVTVRNCDIFFIGGGLQYWCRKHWKTGKPAPVRYGNGIEIWSPAHDYLVERCRFWQIYDAAVTPQQSGSTNGFDRITFRDNVFWQCEYSYEYWNHATNSHSFDVVFEHNTSVDAGGCWSHSQRPDQNGAHLMSYSHVGAMRNQVIRNNVFCRSTDRGFRFFTDWRSTLAMDHNLHYEPLNVLSESHANWKTGLSWCFRSGPAEFARYQSVTGLDADSAYGEPQFVDPDKRDYRLKPGTIGTDMATDGGPVGARNMPGLDRDQSVEEPTAWQSFWNWFD